MHVEASDNRRPRRHLVLGTILVCHLAGAASTATAALCGDSSGDGFLNAADALATLSMAVRGAYDRRGDVVPPGGDGALQASDALALLRAAVEDRVPECAGAGATRAVVTTAAEDFSSAGIAVVDVATREVRRRAGAISGDSVIRTPAGQAVVINRNLFNTLQAIDIDAPGLPTTKECSVSDGFNSNPQDVVFASTSTGYVTPYAGGRLLVIDPEVLLQPSVDPACTGLIRKRLDLRGFDEDGIPEMDQMAIVGDDLFVSLQLLDQSFQPRDSSAVVVIDTLTDTVKGSIPLSFTNPFAATKGLPWDPFQQRIFVGGPGAIGTDLTDGGIEAIDPVAMASTGLLVSGADLGADIFDFVVVGTARAYAIVADRHSNSVIDIDLRTRTVRNVLLSSTDLISDIEMTERGELWVAFRGDPLEQAAGIRIFRVTDRLTGNLELTETPIDLGQAPFTIAFVD
jgi:hypothetical protein